MPPDPYTTGVLPYGANPPPPSYYNQHAPTSDMGQPMMNQQMHPMMMNQPMMVQPMHPMMMNQPMMGQPNQPVVMMMGQPNQPMMNQPMMGQPMMGQPMHPMMPMIVVQQPQQQQPIIVVQQPPPPQPTGPTDYDTNALDTTPKAPEPAPPPVVTTAPDNTKTYVLAEDKTKSTPTKTTSPDPEKGGQYIGVPRRTYPSVECTFGRWLMWDAMARSWIAFMPSHLEPKGCCDAIGRCCGWMLWALLLPFTILLVILFGIVGFFADIMVFFAWLFTFGFCCKRCKSKCDVVYQPPHNWFQSCCAIFTCSCC